MATGGGAPQTTTLLTDDLLSECSQNLFRQGAHNVFFLWLSNVSGEREAILYEVKYICKGDIDGELKRK